MTIRAVLDSSVLISALITPQGAAGQVLDAAEAGLFIMCLSREIIAETAEALLRNAKLQARYGIDRAAVDRFCTGLAVNAEMATELPALRAVPLDPKDDPNRGDGGCGASQPSRDRRSSAPPALGQSRGHRHRDGARLPRSTRASLK